MDHSSVLKNFGKKVRDIRVEQKISQEELADRAGLHRTYIGMIERAEKTLPLKTLKKLRKL